MIFWRSSFADPTPTELLDEMFCSDFLPTRRQGFNTEVPFHFVYRFLNGSPPFLKRRVRRKGALALFTARDAVKTSPDLVSRRHRSTEPAARSCSIEAVV